MTDLLQGARLIGLAAALLPLCLLIFLFAALGVLSLRILAFMFDTAVMIYGRPTTPALRAWRRWMVGGCLTCDDEPDA